MAGVNTKTNQNQYEFVQLQSPMADEAVSLNRPCKRFTLVAPANNQNPNTFFIAVISFGPLALPQPFNLNSLPTQIAAFPLFFWIGSSRSDRCPTIKFRCPFTEFVINFYAINDADATLQQNFATLVCSDDDIEDYVTFGLPGIQLG